MGISAEKHPAVYCISLFDFQHQLSFICSIFDHFWPWSFHLSSYEGQRSAVTHPTLLTGKPGWQPVSSDPWTSSSQLDVHAEMLTHILTTQICCNIWTGFGVPGCVCTSLSMEKIPSGRMKFLQAGWNLRSCCSSFYFRTSLHWVHMSWCSCWQDGNSLSYHAFTLRGREWKKSIHDVWIRWAESCSIDPEMWIYITFQYANRTAESSI